jgi:hypothetical protein
VSDAAKGAGGDAGDSGQLKEAVAILFPERDELIGLAAGDVEVLWTQKALQRLQYAL